MVIAVLANLFLAVKMYRLLQRKQREDWMEMRKRDLEGNRAADNNRVINSFAASITIMDNADDWYGRNRTASMTVPLLSACEVFYHIIEIPRIRDYMASKYEVREVSSKTQTSR